MIGLRPLFLDVTRANRPRLLGRLGLPLTPRSGPNNPTGLYRTSLCRPILPLSITAVPSTPTELGSES